MQVIAAVPEPPKMLVVKRVQERVPEFSVTESATVPVNPLSEATVKVVLPGRPTFTKMLVGAAVTVKSWT